MDKMSLIVYEKTGHVLGAFTRTANPEGAVDAAQIAGPGLIVREPELGVARVTVAPQYLKVQSVDRRDDVLLSHTCYVVVDGLPAWRDPLVAASAVSYTAGTLEIDIGSAPPKDIKVWVHVDDGVSPPIVVSVDIFASGSTGSVPLALTAGSQYGVLVLAPGYRALVVELTA